MINKTLGIGGLVGVGMLLVFLGFSFLQRYLNSKDVVSKSFEVRFQQTQFTIGKSLPDSLSVDFKNFQLAVQKKVNDLSKYRTQADRVITVAEIEDLFCNKEMSVVLHQSERKGVVTKISELYENPDRVELMVSIKDAELDWSEATGFCIRKLSLSLSDPVKK